MKIQDLARTHMDTEKIQNSAQTVNQPVHQTRDPGAVRE